MAKRGRRAGNAAKKEDVKVVSTSAVLPELKQPVSVIIPTAEQKEEKKPEVKVEEPVVKEEVKVETPAKVEEVKVEEPAAKEEVKSEEPLPILSSESFLEDFPKAEPETNKPGVTILKPEGEVIKKETVVSSPIEYPPSSLPKIAEMRKNPAYSRLTDSALLRIASAKLRSKYFFK